jgi:DNA-binding response OmpR family regulator
LHVQQPYKILIVEDEIDITELIRATLMSSSYSITCVDTGTAALAALASETPDLILLDILIPEPDGWEIYKTIRSNADFRNTRVIIMTALLLAPDFLKGKVILPADKVMKKPFELDELVANVKDILEAE